MNAAATTVYLKDYRHPAFLIPEVALGIALLTEDEARVRAELAVRRNPEGDASAALVLDIDEVVVESVAIECRVLPASAGPPTDPTWPSATCRSPFT